MPVHNAERHLQEAIESILSQTLGDFEFLIVNDASTDGSEDIIHSCKDRRIRYVANQENEGIGRTLNKGLALAGSEFVARMDADDISHPERLRLQYGHLSSDPECSLVSASTNVIDEDGCFLRRERNRSEHLYFNLTFLCWIYHPTVMYRRSAILELGGYNAGFGEDYNLWSRLIRKHKAHHLHDVLLDYRVSEGSACHSVHKMEYLDAEKSQVMENLRYFMGNDYELPDAYLECYRNNMDPLLEGRDVKAIVLCLKELDRITEKILQKENINRDAAAIKASARRKRKWILHRAISELSLLRRAELMARTGDFGYLRNLC